MIVIEISKLVGVSDTVSMAPRTHTQAPPLHVADGHDLIRVQGAGVNNLKDISYSAFVQGFMPSLARPEVDVLDGLTTAIIVGQERMGGDARSTVGTATDANALLRILFSRIGQPHIGSPNAFSFNVASVRGRWRGSCHVAGRRIEACPSSIGYEPRLSVSPEACRRDRP